MHEFSIRAFLTILVSVSPLALSAQDLLITEFVAERTVGVVDNFGDPSDFIEIYNAGPSDVDLEGYFLSDGCTDRFKWSFPAGVTIDSERFLVVWASEKDARDPNQPLHTNFRFDGAGGECVTLTDPFGDQLQSENFYPKQYTGYSYGIPMNAAPSSFSLVLPNAPCTVAVPSPSNPISGTGWTLPGYDDSSWTSGTTGVGYDTTPDYRPLISLNLGSTMQNVNPSCYIRIPFQVDDPAAITNFEFAMQYDDGFVAYINGTRVTSRNAPAILNSGSLSDGFQPDANAFNFEPAVFDEGTPTLVMGENIFAIHGLNETVGSSDFLARPRLDASGTGGMGEIVRGERHYFPVPTPGSGNVTGAPDVSPEPLFSEPAGAYLPGLEIVLEMENPVAGTEIRYTLDESIPNAGSTLYNGPIPVDDEVVITARAFVPGLLPSEPTSEYYVILGSDVVNFNSTVPIVICSMLGRSLPGASPNTCGQGPYTPGRLVIIGSGGALIRITDAPHFQHRVGYRKRGNPDFSCGREKFFFNVETRDWEGKDDNQAFFDFPAHSDFAMWGPHEFDRAFMRNAIAYWMDREAGGWSPRTQFVECFLRNPGAEGELTLGDYWGVYVLSERVERGNGRVDVNRLSEVDNEEPRITGGYILKRDRIESGDTRTTVGLHQNVVFTYPRTPTTAQTNWATSFFNQAVTSLGPEIGSQEDTDLIDVQSFLDHHIISWFMKNIDAFRLSGFFHKSRAGLMKMGPLWDLDRSAGCAVDPRPVTPEGYFNDNAWDGGTRYFENPGPGGDGGLIGTWYGRLFNNQPPTGDSPWNDAYRARWRELRAGPLSSANILSQIDEWAAALLQPAARNFSRWPATAPRFGSYQGEVNHLKDWLSDRADWIDSEFGQFIAPPAFNHPGGAVFPGFEVELSSSVGVIFYTLNGPDPRGGGGSVAAGALVYGDPITIEENTRIRARVRTGGDWSALAEEGYTTSEVSLVVTEVMYNPRAIPGDGFGKSLYEFIEFYNPGAETIDLVGVVMANPFFDFTDSAVTTLGSGEYVVVARSEEAFLERYGLGGIEFAGAFSGALGNTAHEILVTGAAGEVLINFSYQDTWEPSTDGLGPSLVILDPTADPTTWNSASSWRASFLTEGSPGREDTNEVQGLRVQGDVNSTGKLDIADATGFLFNLFGQITLTPCLTEEAMTTLQDVDGDSTLTVNDAVYLLRYLFLAGPPPDRGAGCTVIDDCVAACAS